MKPLILSLLMSCTVLSPVSPTDIETTQRDARILKGYIKLGKSEPIDSLPVILCTLTDTVRLTVSHDLSEYTIIGTGDSLHVYCDGIKMLWHRGGTTKQSISFAVYPSLNTIIPIRAVD